MTPDTGGVRDGMNLSHGTRLARAKRDERGFTGDGINLYQGEPGDITVSTLEVVV